ncbi:MAG: histidinol-phosphate transaminase [Dermatophilus congolensis]|nr:histidinol-phosphate transaminase [Dermatophilus congolensis]
MSSAASHPDPVRMRRALDAIAPYKPGRPPASAEGPSYKVSSNENPYPPLPSVLATIAEAAGTVNRYPGMGMHDLRGRIAELCGVSPDEVVPGAGSCGVLGQIVNATVGDNDEVVYAWRSFELYPILVGLSGGRSVQVPLTEDGRHDLQAMLGSITAQTTLVLLCTPNNPTGPVITHAEAENFLSRMPHDVLVVIDEAYVEFNRDPEAVDSLRLFRDYPNVVVLRTFSKAYGLAGLRVGYGIANEAVAEALGKTRMPFAVTDLAQTAAVASLDATGELAERVEAIVAERQRVAAALRDQGWVLPLTEANFVWFPLGRRTDEFVEAAGARGLSVRGFSGDGARCTIDVPEANDLLIEVARGFAPGG